jgi:hypothetical protein
MSSLGADDISSKNVTFYGEQFSKKNNVRSGAVNLKIIPGMHIPTNDFDELNKLIDGDTSQSPKSFGKGGYAAT